MSISVKAMLLVAPVALFYCVKPASAGNCVDFEWTSGSWGYFKNYCNYTVLIRAKFNNGYTGLWGPLGPGRRATAHPYRGNLQASRATWWICNYSANPACSP